MYPMGDRFYDEQKRARMQSERAVQRESRRFLVKPTVAPEKLETHAEEVKKLNGISKREAKAHLRDQLPEKKRNRKRKHEKRYLGSDFYKSPEWRRLRYAVLAFYGRACMACGSTKGAAHVDHIQPRLLRPDLSLAFSNLQVLCEACNQGKGYRDSKDWRTPEQAIEAQAVQSRDLVRILMGKAT